MYYWQTVFFQAPNIVMPPPLTWHDAWWVNIGPCPFVRLLACLIFFSSRRNVKDRNNT